MSQAPSIPPRLPLRFLRWFCKPDLLEDVEGDLSELFAARYAESKSKARWLYFRDVLLLFRPGIVRNFELKNGLINTAMIKNFLKIAMRNALRYKGVTVLNLLGLIVGLTSSALILLWVNDEVRIDKFHENGDRIYQVFRNMRQSNGVVRTTYSIPKPAVDLMQAEYPEVKEVAMLSWEVNGLLGYNNINFQSDGYYATRSFLTMFTFPLILGDEQSALEQLNAIVISERLAERIFGGEWREKAIGSLLTLDNVYLGDTHNATITGIFKNPENNSSLSFDWLLPAQTFFGPNEWVDNWGNGSFKGYFTVDSEEDANAVAKRIHNEILDHAGENDMAGDETLIIQKFEEHYLHSEFDNGVIAGGRIDYVRIMIVVAGFILLIACINFMNLATARSGRRSKEIGLRKVMGAQKKAIRFQFFLESTLTVAFAVAVSVLVVFLLLPNFNMLVGKELSIDFADPLTWYAITGTVLLVGLISGSYPALLLPTFRIIDSIKGSLRQRPSAGRLRKGLVVFQFAISTLLIIGTAVIYQQIQFVLTKDLGFEKENLVAVSMEGDLGTRYETYKTELMKIPEVQQVTVASGNPVRYGRSTSSASWEGKDPGKGYEINVILSDEAFVEAMGMEMLAGRSFSDQLVDSTNFLINEVAAELMGFEDPINKELSFWGIDGKIVGVVKNFHMYNMHEPIAPLIITCIDPSSSVVAMVRLQGDPMEGLKEVEEITKALNPAFEFQYEFVDQTVEGSYQSEMTVGTLAKIFTGISIFISCLGLFGLSSFSAEQRAKEIGVRKVHGANVGQLVLLLSREYTRLMIFAFVLALPFGYFYAKQWLQNFEFRMNLDPVVFILAGLITFIIGALTVSFKSYQAATGNPIQTLRDE